MTCRSDPAPRDDEGSILLLVIGTVVVLAMLLALVVDTGRLYLDRRSLDGTTDAAALAGAQAVDLDATYAGTSARDLVLDESEVRRAVASYLATVEADGRYADFSLVAVDVDATEVTVRTAAAVRLPFAGPVLGGRGVVTITSSATARNHPVAD